jgi:hypothetical protein
VTSIYWRKRSAPRMAVDSDRTTSARGFPVRRGPCDMAGPATWLAGHRVGLFWTSDIARPDVSLALVVTALPYVVALIASPTRIGSPMARHRHARHVGTRHPGVDECGVRLYWGVSTVVGGMQSMLLSRHVCAPPGPLGTELTGRAGLLPRPRQVIVR